MKKLSKINKIFISLLIVLLLLGNLVVPTVMAVSDDLSIGENKIDNESESQQKDLTDVTDSVKTEKEEGNLGASKENFTATQTPVQSSELKDGIYTIKSALNENFVLDVSGASTDDCANVQLWENKNVDNQKFKIEKINGSEYYKITAVHSRKVLDVQGDLKNPGANLDQYVDFNADNQAWILQDCKNGYYNIISKSSNLYIDVNSGKVANGVNIQLEIKSDEKSQMFKLYSNENSSSSGSFETGNNKPSYESGENGSTNIQYANIDNGTYYIKSAMDEGLVLDVAGASVENCANIELWENKNGNNQRFNVTRINGTNYYKIVAVHSNKSLDVYANGQKPGTNIEQYEDYGTDNQLWIIQDTKDGYFNIISKSNGLYVDACNGVAANGTNIQVTTGNQSKAQKFKLENVNGNNNAGNGSEVTASTIKEGVYVVRSALNEGLVLDVAAGSVENCANIELWENKNGNNQKFRITKVDDKYYKMTALHSSKVLDVQGNIKKSGTNVEQFVDFNSENQSWLFKKNDDGYYSIISKASGLYLDAYCGIAANGTNIQVATGNGSKAQKFKLDLQEDNSNNNPPVIDNIPLNEGIYNIKSAINENFGLDIEAASTENCANLQLWQNGGTNNQRFIAQKVDDTYFKLIPVHSLKALDVFGDNKQPGTNVDQYTDYGTGNQLWTMKSAGNGYYYIVSKSSGLYLDVNMGIAANGTNIQVTTGNESNAQKFKFEKNEKANDFVLMARRTIPDGVYSINLGLNYNYVLDVSNAAQSNCGNIEVWNDNKNLNQKFVIKYLNNGCYKIKALHSEKVMDVANGSTSAGANVQQYEQNGTDAQQWVIEQTANGYYIRSKASGLYLDVCNANASNGANIQVMTKTGSNAQVFNFSKCDMISEINTSKYPGYKEKLQQLQNAHPNWTFQLLYTGLNFNSAVAGECSVHSRNLIPTSYTGEWLCPVCGTKSYDSGWHCASNKAVAYYMDPRNLLDNTNIFQFQDVNEYIDDTISTSDIYRQVSGTFLANYSNDIATACRNTGVNPFYIISRLIQEQGRSGTQIGRGMDGGDGCTYYNPFNIGASGNGYSEIYANALQSAKNRGWNSMEKALEGGIAFCKDYWLNNYQNTLYTNRFDIEGSRNNSSYYSHQYMQNLMGAYSEARLLSGMYSNVNGNFTFIIPMFEGMTGTESPAPSSATETYALDMETTGTDVRLRDSAGGNILKTISNSGTRLISLQRGVNSDWVKVLLKDSSAPGGKYIGYISSQFVKQIPEVTTCNYAAQIKTHDGDGCKIRSGPSTSADSLGAYSDGTSFNVIDNSTYTGIDGYNWFRVRLPNGTQGFLPGCFVQ